MQHLSHYADSDRFNEIERAAIEYAEHLTRNPAKVPEELFERLSTHLNERQLVELTATIAWENFVGRFNRGFDIQPYGFSAGSYCVLPDTPE